MNIVYAVIGTLVYLAIGMTLMAARVRLWQHYVESPATSSKDVMLKARILFPVWSGGDGALLGSNCADFSGHFQKDHLWYVASASSCWPLMVAVGLVLLTVQYLIVWPIKKLASAFYHQTTVPLL
jgi:hypothetical protein